MQVKEFYFNFKCLLLTVLICFFSLFTPLHAQEKERDTSAVYHLKEVKVQAFRAEDSFSVSPVQTISGKQLQRLNSLSVADAIRYFTGVQLKDYGGIGGLKTVNVRSLGTNHTAVFYDGVQIGNAQNGQVDLGKFSLDHIEAISLFNGQKNQIFIPAKAFASASSIYLKSRKPTFTEGKQTNIGLNLKGGSFGLLNPSVLWEQKWDKNIASYVSTEYLTANGRYPFSYTNGVYDTTALRSNTAITAYRMEAALFGNLKDSSTWHIQIYNYQSNRGLPGAVVANKFDYTQKQWDRNSFVQATFNLPKRNRYKLMLNAKYANDYQRYLDPEIVSTNGLLDNRFHQQEAYFSLAQQYRISSIWDISLSTDYQYNTLDANLYRFAYPRRHQLYTAIATSFHLSQFNLQANLLETFVHDEVKQYNSAGHQQKLTPAILASWQPFAKKEFYLRAFYKEIFRMPTFNDLYYTFVGTAQLKPEKATQYNLGFTLKSGKNHSLTLKTDAFYNTVSDKIVAIPGTNLYRWIMYNIGEVKIKGIETNLQYQKNITSLLSFSGSVNYTYQQARDVTAGNRSSFNIPYIPVNSGSVTANIDWQNWQFNYSYLYSGERYSQLSNQQNSIYNYLEPFYTHDLSFGYQKTLKTHPFRLMAELNNIFNQDREIVANFPLPRRFYRLTLSYTI